MHDVISPHFYEADMRKFKFSSHPAESEPLDTLTTDVEPEGGQMDPRLPLIGAAIFAAVVAAGGWNFKGGSAPPMTDTANVQLTANSTVVPPQAGTMSGVPTSTPAVSASGETPSPSFAVPSPVPQRNREREESNHGAVGTPETHTRERDDDD